MTKPSLFGEAYRPDEIAAKVAGLGVTKAKADFLTLLSLSVLAGAYIALGAFFYMVVVSGHTEVSGTIRFVGGLSFSLGLVLVVVGGAELFTGNNLMAMAWATRLISSGDLLRNWSIVYMGNMIGSIGTVALIFLAGSADLMEGKVGETISGIAIQKINLTWLEALVRGVLCNALVCLAVWLAMGGRSLTDKVLAILLPISGFVTMGFEHVIANWFILPLGYLLDVQESISLSGIITNLILVTAGNILGGTLLVAGVYWVAYLRPTKSNPV
jgi:formate/nitrite transporter